MMRRILKNWKTSLVGIVSGLPLLVEGIIVGDPVKITTALGAIFIGLLAKDSDKEGV